MVKPYLNQVGGDVKSDVNMFTGGLNVYTDKAFIDSNHMPYVMNMTMNNPPMLETRGGRSTLAYHLPNNEYPESPYLTNDVIKIIPYTEFQFYVIIREGENVCLVEYKRPESSVGHSPDFNVRNLFYLHDEQHYYYTIVKIGGNDYLYVTGRTFKLKIWLNYDNDPLKEWRWWIEDGYYGVCCWHKGRLFLVDPSTNIVTYSALRKPDNFEEAHVYQLVQVNFWGDLPENLNTDYIYLVDDGNNNYIEYQYSEEAGIWENIGSIPKNKIKLDDNGMSLPDYSDVAGDFLVTNSVGDIVSMKSFDDKLIILCEHTIHALYGSDPEFGGTNTFQLVDINNNLGALLDSCVAIGGGRLFFLGDNHEVYEYTGSALNIITRPGTTRNSTISVGGISGLIEAKDVFEGASVDTGNSSSTFVATAEKLYINIWNRKRTANEKLLFVFDIYNRLWWCEDGTFNTIGNFRDYNNQILLAKGKDLLINNQDSSVDEVYNFSTKEIEELPINYEFHTRVYGADGLDMLKSISEVWFQARAEAEVYLNDIWSSQDYWQIPAELHSNLLKIGTLKYEIQQPVQQTKYRPETYEQQVCYIEKMYGERLNAFQIVVKGVGASKFWLMKRVWRTR